MNRLRNTSAAPPRRVLLLTLALVLGVHMAALFGSSERPHDRTPIEPPEEKTLRWLATDLQAGSAPEAPKTPKPRASKAIPRVCRPHKRLPRCLKRALMNHRT